MTDRSIASVTDELGVGDGIDTREERRQRSRNSSKKRDNSTVRFAGEIRNILDMEILHCGHPILASFLVATVEPYGVGTNFFVRVYSTDSSLKYDPDEVKSAPLEMKPKLRMEVVGTINRKKAPDFKFDVLPPGVQSRQ